MAIREEASSLLTNALNVLIESYCATKFQNGCRVGSFCLFSFSHRLSTEFWNTTAYPVLKYNEAILERLLGELRNHANLMTKTLFRFLFGRPTLDML